MNVFRKCGTVLVALAMMTILAVASSCGGGSTAIETGKGTPAACDLFLPMRCSSADTAGTQEQCDRHNSVWVCLCEKDCP